MKEKKDASQGMYQCEFNEWINIKILNLFRVKEKVYRKDGK